MDILRKLQSILAPPTTPEVRSRLGQLRPEAVAPFSFDRTLGDALQIDPFRRLDPIEIGTIASQPIPIPEPQIDPPIVPRADPEPLIDVSHASTLEATIAAASRATATVAAQPAPDPAPAISSTGVAAAADPAPVSASEDSSGMWAPLSLRGSGAQGLGIDGSDAGVTAELNLKFAYYSEPERYGITLNREGRMFRDAVAQGHVPNTPEGLGTMLGYLSLGSFASAGSPARPAAITSYFKSFFPADVQAYG